MEKKSGFWKLSIFILFLLIISVCVNFYESLNRVVPDTNSISELPRASTPSPIPGTMLTSILGKSYGIFYPFSSGITINNNLPTIIGKIDQTSDIYLETKFSTEESPASGEDEYFLRFLPGRVKNLKVMIDGIEVKPVFGIPQYPTLSCKNINYNSNNTSSYDLETWSKSPPDDIFDNETDCIANKKSELPPLVFFARPAAALSDGKHVMTLEGKGEFKSFNFWVDTDFHHTSQNLYIVDKASPYYYYNQYPLLQTDSCSPGYYYDKSYLKMPLPSFNNPNLFYGISFPQSKDEVGNIDRRRVQISFENRRFDLFFPQSSIYYEGKSLTDRDNLLSSYHELFIPRDNLVFPNGAKANYIDAYEIIPQDGNYASGYFEVFPVDISGGVYDWSIIPRVMSGSSACDG